MTFSTSRFRRLSYPYLIISNLFLASSVALSLPPAFLDFPGPFQTYISYFLFRVPSCSFMGFWSALATSASGLSVWPARFRHHTWFRSRRRKRVRVRTFGVLLRYRSTEVVCRFSITIMTEILQHVLGVKGRRIQDVVERLTSILKVRK